MSHTPGPWRVARYTNYVGYSISAGTRGCIAERWYPTELDEKEDAEMAANARLIAAAPELLEALNGMIGLIALMVGRSDIPSPAKESAIDSHRWVAAHAAISKATGGDI